MSQRKEERPERAVPGKTDQRGQTKEDRPRRKNQPDEGAEAKEQEKSPARIHTFP